jgi:DNA-binding response OmpR family regulator
MAISGRRDAKPLHLQGDAGTPAVVLVVDDNVELAREIADFLGRYEFRCVIAENWDAACAVIESERPDAIILDQFLGYVDTLPQLPRLRHVSDAPILVLTSNQEEADRIVGLELGADDFLRKPVSGRELVARVRAHLRRPRRNLANEGRAEGAWTIDRRAHRLLRPDGSAVHLTTAEFDVFAILAAEPGEVHSRESLTRVVFRRPWQTDDRAVDTIVANLRAKIDAWGGVKDATGETCIGTIRGVGYKFVKFPA